jgi:hypothetical protein
VLLSSEQTGFVEWTAAEGVSSNAKAQDGAATDFQKVAFWYSGAIGNLQLNGVFLSYQSAKRALITVVQSAIV